MRIVAIAGRELRALFCSPLAWTVLAVLQVILAYLFLIQVEAFVQWQSRLAAIPGAPGLTQIAVMPLLKTAGFVLMLLVPLLTMRLISEERRSGTFALLASAPVTMTEIVLGKFGAVFAFLVCMLGLVALLPLSLLAGGTLDFGLLAAGLLGLLLLGSAFASAGLFVSTLTTQPPVAAVSTFGLLLLLWILDLGAATGTQSETQLFRHLSVLAHFDTLLKGEVGTQDLAYFALFISTFLGLSIRRLDALRLQH